MEAFSFPVGDNFSMWKYSLLEKWPHFTDISGKFVMNDDVIKMADDQKNLFSHILNVHVL